MSNLQSPDRLISLEGKRALITGGAAGIGKAIARRLASAGAALELVDIDGDGLAAARSELESCGADVRVHTADISAREDRDKLWESLAGQGPDVLVNNAGIYPFRSFLDVDEGFYRQVMGINLDAVYWMCQHMIRKRRKRGGVIVNIGSIEAILPLKDDLAHYSVSKAGVIALTRALAKEHGKHGFRINVIVPGGILTEGTKRVARGLLRAEFGLLKAGLELKQRLPIGRLGRPDEVARMVLVLASDLSSYVHGAVIPVDGGFLAA
jgi:NAD(P)-dependent dehydrogenase (short-subunit alcohol dehydrogenase family)